MRALLLLLLLASALAPARTCGTISNAAGKKMSIPCPKRPLVRAPAPAVPGGSASPPAPAQPVQLAAQPSASFSARQEKLKEVINKVAQNHQMDEALIHAVISVESGYQQQAISQKGAIGLMQLMPATADYLRVNPHDEQANIDGGTRYLKEQLQRFHRLDLALAAYNAGPQNVIRYKEQIPPFPETQEYVRRVLAYHSKYQNDWKEHIK